MRQWIQTCLLLISVVCSIICAGLVVGLYVRSSPLPLWMSTSFKGALPVSNDEWSRWKETYNIVFLSAIEDQYRFSVWKENIRFINAHNAKPWKSYTMGVNQFTHLAHWEFVETFLRSSKDKSDVYDLEQYFEGNTSVRTNRSLTGGMCYLKPKDWRDIGVTNIVGDQGPCGSCWAFAAVSAVEWHLEIEGGDRKGTRLSTQHLVDCVSTNFGCNGGVIENAMKFMQEKGSIPDKSYPYKKRVTQCKHDPTEATFHIKGYEALNGLNEYALACVLQNKGPIVTALDASGQGLQHYSSGIYTDTDCNSEYLNHAVVFVGYGRETDGTFYWVAQNSWSDQWGENGFFRMAFGSNQCGIQVTPVLPVL